MATEGFELRNSTLSTVPFVGVTFATKVSVEDAGILMEAGASATEQEGGHTSHCAIGRPVPASHQREQQLQQFMLLHCVHHSR